MKLETIKIRIQTLEYFENNFYQDIDGDWWETEKTYLKYRESLLDHHYNPTTERFLHLNGIELGVDVFGKIIDIYNKERRHWQWAVQEYITKENYPEYYL